jgi:CDP-diacylglycerol--serine O-phosphatidyltransferase
VGLPIPAGGGAIAAIVHFFSDPLKSPLGANLMASGVFLLAFLMISTFRYSSFKNLTLGRKSHLTILVMALLVALVVFLSKPTLLALAAAYIVSGPIARIYGILRRKKPSEEMTLADSMQHH